MNTFRQIIDKLPIRRNFIWWEIELRNKIRHRDSRLRAAQPVACWRRLSEPGQIVAINPRLLT